MISIKFDSGVYGVGGSIRVYEAEQEVARHWWSDEARVSLLNTKIKPYVGKYDHETQRYELSFGIPPVLLNALLRDPQARPRLPMGNRVERLEPKMQEFQFLEYVNRCNLCDGIILDDRYLVALSEERDWASGYYLSSSIRIKSILEIADLQTGKKHRDEVKIPDVIDSRRLDRHYGWKIKYTWPVRHNKLIFETDNRTEIRFPLSRLK